MKSEHLVFGFHSNLIKDEFENLCEAIRDEDEETISDIMGYYKKRLDGYNKAEISFRRSLGMEEEN